MKKLLLSVFLMQTAIVSLSAQTGTYLPAEATTNMKIYQTINESYPVTNITDGNLSTKFWSGTAQAAGDYILLTLDDTYSIGEVRIYFQQNDQPGGVAKVQISTDNLQWTDISVITPYNIGDSNRNYLHMCDADSRQARYVRLYLEEDSPLWLQVAEFQVYEYVSEKTEAPTFSVDDGVHLIKGSETEVIITSEEGATIYYTTDGSWPDENSNKIDSGEALQLDTNYPWETTNTIKAISIMPGKEASVLSVFSYVIAIPYCFSSCPAVGKNYNYVGQIDTFTTTGARTDANWTNPASGDVNGYVGTIENVFTALPGQTITINITTHNTKWGAIRVYVDKNGNYLFDPDENIARVGEPGGGSGDNISVTQEFTIDPTTLAGTYLVRVLFVANNDEAEYNSADACGTYEYGGYYDFAFDVLTENKEITITTKEPQDAAYAVVSIRHDETAPEIPVTWELDNNSVASEELIIDVPATAEAPEIYMYGNGSVFAEIIRVNRSITANQWVLMSLPFDLNLTYVRVNGYMARYGTNIRIMEYDGAKRASGSVDGYTASGWTEKTSGIIPSNTGFSVIVNPTGGAEQVVTFAAASFHMDANDKDISLNRHESIANVASDGKSTDADWNLRGNPMLQSATKGTGYSLYIYDGATDSYSEHSGAETPAYPPFTAWFVQSDDGFTSMSFSHTASAGSDMETNIAGRFAISINGGEDEARVTVLGGSSESYVRNEDAMYFAPNSDKVSQIYLIDGDGSKIASSVVPAPYDEVKLAYKAVKSGEQTLTVTSMIPGTAVYLVDNETGKETQLDEGSEYTFTSAVGTNTNRFKVKTIANVAGITENTVDNSTVSAAVTGNKLVVRGVSAGKTIDVYTVSGVLLSRSVAVSEENEIILPAEGILLIKAGDAIVKLIK